MCVLSFSIHYSLSELVYNFSTQIFTCEIDLQAGPRICLGKDFAYRQMKILSIALLHFFRFKLADEAKTVTYRTMFTLHIDGDLPLSAVARKAAT